MHSLKYRTKDGQRLEWVVYAPTKKGEMVEINSGLMGYEPVTGTHYFDNDDLFKLCMDFGFKDVRSAMNKATTP